MNVCSLIFLLTFISYGRSQSSPCTPPGGGDGNCISVYSCPTFLNILLKPTRTNEELEMVQSAACGYSGSTPKVCCPEQCFTPEGQPGTCVSIYDCGEYSQRLRQPTNRDLLYVQAARCQSSVEYSVCCPNSKEIPKKIQVCKATALTPDPRTQCCGIEGTQDKIVGGEATSIDQYPWLALIEYKKGALIKTLCGAVLISGRYVLTAGHCLSGKVLQYGTPTNVRLGEYDTKNDGNDCVTTPGGGQYCTKGVTIIPIERIILHPGYDPAKSQRNDIALIRLSQMADYTDFVRPICLPVVDDTTSPPKNFYLWAAGWGAVDENTPSSNVKQHVGLPFRSLESCQPAYSTSTRRVTLWEKQMCAGGEKLKDTCKGDSGGPLMYQNEKIFELLGIVSFGPTICGAENVPGVYTKVFAYKQWIRNQIVE